MDVDKDAETKDKTITVDGIEYLLINVGMVKKVHGYEYQEGFHAYKMPQNHPVGRFSTIDEFLEMVA